MRKSDEKTAQEGGNCTNKLPDGGTQSINNSRGFFSNSLTQGTRLIRFNIVNVMVEKGINVLLTQMTSQILYLSPNYPKPTCISTQTITLEESKD